MQTRREFFAEFLADEEMRKQLNVAMQTQKFFNDRYLEIFHALQDASLRIESKQHLDIILAIQETEVSPAMEFKHLALSDDILEKIIDNFNEKLN